MLKYNLTRLGGPGTRGAPAFRPWTSDGPLVGMRIAIERPRCWNEDQHQQLQVVVRQELRVLADEHEDGNVGMGRPQADRIGACGIRVSASVLPDDSVSGRGRLRQPDGHNL